MKANYRGNSNGNVLKYQWYEYTFNSWQGQFDFKVLKCLNYIYDITLKNPHLFSLDYNDEIQRGDEENVVDGTLCICFVPMKSNAEEMFFDALEEMPPPGESKWTGWKILRVFLQWMKLQFWLKINNICRKQKLLEIWKPNHQIVDDRRKMRMEQSVHVYYALPQKKIVKETSDLND